MVLIDTLLDCILLAIFSGLAIMGGLAIMDEIIKPNKMNNTEQQQQENQHVKNVKAALDIATQKGAFNLEQAAVIYGSIKSLEMTISTLEKKIELLSNKTESPVEMKKIKDESGNATRKN